MMKGLKIFITLLLLASTTTFGQVGDVNKNIEKDKSNSSNKEITTAEINSQNNSNSWFFGFIIEAFAATIGAAQVATLNNLDLYPERVSLESFVSIGTGLNEKEYFFQTGVRGNWGIIATDFKYNDLWDSTGKLQTIDWAVLMFRVPIRSFKIDYGLGFIGVIGKNQSYFNSSIGFDWRIQELRMNINSAYQWSEKTSSGERFKKGFVARVDYEVYRRNKMHICPLIELSYQNYFDQTTFALISGGVMMRIY